MPSAIINGEPGTLSYAINIPIPNSIDSDSTQKKPLSLLKRIKMTLHLLHTLMAHSLQNSELKT